MTTGSADAGWKVTHFPLSTQVEMPWKNGGGTTREIGKHEDENGPVWRASIATIHQSGPFSLFEGCDRIITLINGPPVALDFQDGEHLVLESFVPQHFSCDRPVSATVTGTSHDLNLIWRRNAVSVSHSLAKVDGTDTVHLPVSQFHLVVACKGALIVEARGRTETLAAGEALLFGMAAPGAAMNLTLSAQAATALVFSMTEPAP